MSKNHARDVATIVIAALFEAAGIAESGQADPELSLIRARELLREAEAQGLDLPTGADLD